MSGKLACGVVVPRALKCASHLLFIFFTLASITLLQSSVRNFPMRPMAIQCVLLKTRSKQRVYEKVELLLKAQSIKRDIFNLVCLAVSASRMVISSYHESVSLGPTPIIPSAGVNNLHSTKRVYERPHVRCKKQNV
jgi:hypothetical protein